MLPKNKRKEAQQRRIEKRFSGTPRTFFEEDDDLIESQKPAKSGWDPFWVLWALVLASVFGFASPWIPFVALLIWLIF